MSKEKILEEFDKKFINDNYLYSTGNFNSSDPVVNKIKQFISDIIAQTREETIKAIPEEMKHDQETDSEESKTWIAGFNNCRNQILNKLKK